MTGRSPEFMYPFGEIFGFNEITISDYSSKYIFRRKVFKSALHVFGSGVDKSVERAGRAVDIAIEEIDLKLGHPFCPKKLLDSAILVQLWEWLSAKSEPIDGTTITSLRELHDLLSDIGKQSPLYHFLPFLRFFPTQFRRNIKRCRDIVHAVFERQFKEHQKTYTPDVVRDLTDSFISAYKNELAKENDKDIGSINDIAILMLDVTLGGSFTTSTSLTWFILYMVLREDIQCKVHEEIDKVVGDGHQPNFEDISNMPYLQSTLCEVQRISGVVPFTGTNAIRDTSIRGYDIPKGTHVIQNIKYAHLDPKEWPEPEQFKPERFLDSDGGFAGWAKLHGFIPFGIGRRECAGSSLAKIMMLVFASTLMHRYKLEIPQGSEKPSTEGPLVAAVVRPKDFKIIAKQR